jgi:hypothetical protein
MPPPVLVFHRESKWGDHHVQRHVYVDLIDKSIIANTCDALDDADTIANSLHYIHDRSRWKTPVLEAEGDLSSVLRWKPFASKQ